MRDPGSRQTRILPLKVRGLTYTAGGKRLIDRIDCAFAAGTRTVILGPNGAGKSLFLRLLHGLIVPASGSILWNGNIADTMVRKKQAMVFQQPVLLRRSAGDNLRFALKAKGKGRSNQHDRIESALALAGLADKAQVPARHLSGGEQQKLAIARALIGEPDILFLDEPTASLDPASTLAVEEMMNEAHLRGIKILLVTHDIAQARRLADDIMFIHQGRVTESAAAAIFFGDPQSPPARDYLAGRIPL